MNECKIKYVIEDLLPLYEENLLSDVTKEWFEEQVKGNEELEQLVKMTRSNLIEENDFSSNIDTEKMFKQVNQKLALYQIIFVAISFMFAIRTSLLSNSFGFIISYTLLGLVTYLFYKNIKIVFYISFIPTFLWATGMHIIDFMEGMHVEHFVLTEYIIQSFLGVLMLTLIHFVFSLIGCLLGWLFLQLKKGGHDNAQK
ncbi:hypothetical protein [Evansella cellulosilytica]|uniref:Uncharacterized protein n=1 Tax=Evansella cellulosilytica (strain ATCC 21833 / DSM 2522 / FERM P-1141 / JCM 9156 / N-4) TaxID=649639 RepID=E6TQU0_EVAC2|nr:hypothetical protein [Evansella cellulosilytica]ADU31715.1 hypothetical protein Bcell_3473 [Evansella cellulosilytica DSM 2522]